jgi:hypothetical protein
MWFDVWVENRTPFTAQTYLQPDADGQEVFTAMFSASFSAPNGDADIRPSPEQLPVILGDIPFGAPGRSSTRYESDIAPVKPAAEILVNGTAYAPNDKPVREMQVGIRVGGIRKVLNVMGDRIYDAGGYSPPHPFRSMPVIYERAFGGTTANGDVEPGNPVGVGFRQAGSGDANIRTQAPNITYPDQPFRSPSDRPRPAGFGSLGRGWQPRLTLAGTYDQAWLDTQWPLPPKDFDTRYNLSAPEDQHLPRITGNEQVSLIGLTPSGRWDFKLPRVVAPIRLVYQDRVVDAPFQPDTVLIEPDLFRVTLKARISMVVRPNVPGLREIVFGHVTPAFLHARRRSVPYYSARGADGTIADRPVWAP